MPVPSPLELQYTLPMPRPVDVIVPVYGAAGELDRCLASLVDHTDLATHRLLLVIDGAHDGAVEEVLARHLATDRPAGRIEVLRNGRQLGFVASVNRGMAASADDVVLLNSDTRVTHGWLDKLQAAADSAAEIATVTPFSNHATICSLPRFLAENALPAGYDVDAFAALVERCSLREYPRLPTGVGVCLYVKRQALDRLGLFDAERFGLGYGEESEFSRRAAKAGWAHVLDDATFIYHEGQSSFGASRGRRVAAAHRVMRRLHPEYLAEVSRFIREDPLSAARQRVTAALAPARRPTPEGAPRRIVHLVHGWPPYNRAGTELYAAWLARRQAGDREVAVYARIAEPRHADGDAIELVDHGARVRLLVNHFTRRDPRARAALARGDLDRDFARFLDETRPEVVHVHHLAGHAVSLLDVASRRGLPILYQLQDWWSACARTCLLDRDRRPCSGPAPGKCARCLPLTGRPPAALWNRLLHVDRARRMHRALRLADALVAGSRALAESFHALGLVPADRSIEVLPYGVELPPPELAARRRATPPALPLRFGFLGSILPHKGLAVAVEAFRGVDPRRATLEIWGDPTADPAYADEAGFAAPPPAVSFRGNFAEEERWQVFAGLDLLVMPSLGLESFGLAAREAMAAGVPVLASRRGALPEIGGEGLYAGYFEPGDAAGLRRWVDRLADRPETVAEWAGRLPAVKGMAEHAGEIDRLYAEILARHGRR